MKGNASVFVFLRLNPRSCRMVSIYILKETSIHNTFRFCCLSAQVNIFVWNMGNEVLHYYYYDDDEHILLITMLTIKILSTINSLKKLFRQDTIYNSFRLKEKKTLSFD